MPGWWEGLQVAALVALAAGLWRLNRRVRRLEVWGPPGPHRGPADDSASFATLVSGYRELLSRAPASPRRRLRSLEPASGGADGRRAAGPAHVRPELGEAVALLRQGLDPEEVARRTGRPVGEIRLLERVAQMAGWAGRGESPSH
ncbi:hypothetical protein [Geochorda subterranea]|uniref:DUF2802 domain-containing protein n=1 Tax=Geochorda subterranea TaxID=3109564 RepID=A0ABZ1BKD3_9FIRM|nr:hypothetical protein [Limnochorda sp. LNt]WRP13316.1 hypothetical protein VLY81_07580 [Limnochorda sp. LNt]